MLLPRPLPRLLLVLVLLALPAAAPAVTGGLRGAVKDRESGEGLIGVDLLLVGTALKTATDLDGDFDFGEVPVGTYDLRVTYLGYETRYLAGVEVAAGAVREVEVALESYKAYRGEDLVVSASRVVSTEGALLADRRQAAVAADAISAAQISRSPDGTSGDALKRVPGLTLNEGKYVFVRGVTDRYNVTEVNGVAMASANVDKDRRSFNFDMVPANLLANVTVIKAATPDMPGDFVGGLVRITTLEFPEQATTSVGVSGAHTGGTTGETFHREGVTGSTDWLGIDDGLRDFPRALLARNVNTGTAVFNNDLARALPNHWTARGAAAPPRVGFHVSHGNNAALLGGRLGYMGALSYRNDYELEDETEHRETDEETGGLNLEAAGTNAHMQVTWGGLGNLFFRKGRHRVGLTNTYNRTATSDVRNLAGIDSDKTFAWQTMAWQERTQFVNKLDGVHPFGLPRGELEVAWQGFYGESTATEPDRRYLEYKEGNPAWVMDENMRTWSWLKEFRRGAGLDLTWTLAEDDLELTRKPRFKAGVRRDRRERSFDVEAWATRRSQHPFSGALATLPPDEIFAPENYNPTPDPVNGHGFDFGQDRFNSGVYSAHHDLDAWYVMADLPFSLFQEDLRLVGGVRSEDSDQVVEAIKDKTNPARIDTARVAEVDLLPSVSLTWLYDRHVNVRLGYYASVNRPEFRELAPLLRRNFRTFQNEIGNPDLERATIDNYDARVEVFPGQGEVMAVSGFYKRFADAIEDTLIPSPERFIASFSNVPRAINYGFELEARVQLARVGLPDGLAVAGNYTRIWSEVKFRDPLTKQERTRTLHGQAPWSVNASLLYTRPGGATTLSLLFNKVGRKLDKIADFTALYVYEEPRDRLDFVLTQKFARIYKLKLAVKDILATDTVFTSGAEGREYEYSRVSTGTEFSLGLSARF